LAARDWLARHGRCAPANPKLIFLAIDAACLGLEAKADLKELFGIDDPTLPEAQALALMSENWPWTRKVHAMILDRLVRAGAKAVAFDLMFPTPNEGDPELRAALDRYRDKVVIGSNFTMEGSDASGHASAALKVPSTSLLDASQRGEDRVGFVNFWPDDDGVIRNAQFSLDFGQFAGAPSSSAEDDYHSLAARTVRKAEQGASIPADNASHLFRYTAGPAEGFAPRSLFEIFLPEYWKRNFKSGAVFNDAIVIIGAAGNWQHDEHQTPFGLMAGPEIQLNVVNALLHQEFLTPVSGAVSLLMFFMG
jgi:adenylate cyclase